MEIVADNPWLEGAASSSGSQGAISRPDVVGEFKVIARDKYTAARQADDATLRLMPGEVLSRYFVADSLPETGDSRFVRLGKESVCQPTFPFA